MADQGGVNSPMVRLMLANSRAAEIRRERAIGRDDGFPSVLRGEATHSGALLLEALEEQGWTLAQDSVIADIHTERDMLESEVERLRAALTEIRVRSSQVPIGFPGHPIAAEITMTAAAALEGGEHAG